MELDGDQGLGDQHGQHRDDHPHQEPIVADDEVRSRRQQPEGAGVGGIIHHLEEEPEGGGRDGENPDEGDDEGDATSGDGVAEVERVGDRDVALDGDGHEDVG